MLNILKMVGDVRYRNNICRENDKHVTNISDILEKDPQVC